MIDQDIEGNILLLKNMNVIIYLSTNHEKKEIICKSNTAKEYLDD